MRPSETLPVQTATGHPLNLADKPKSICFFGKKGSGKTTTIGGQLNDCKPPVVILDVLGNFNSNEFFNSQSVSETITEINKQISSDRFKVISLKTNDPELSVEFISAALYEANGGTLILDEVDAFKITENGCFDSLIRYGRNKNVSLITGCRRPAEINRNITAGANSLWVLKTNEPRDIDYYCSTILGDYAYQLMSIPEWHGLYVDYDLSEKGIYKIDKGGKIFKLKSERL